MGDHRLPDAHRRPHHRGVLLSSVDENRDLVLPNRPDRSRDDRARRRDQCRHERRRRPGTAALQVGQLETAGGGRDRAPQDRRGRCRTDRGADGHRGGRGQDPGSQERPPAGPGRARDQAGAVQAQSGHRPAPRHREAPSRGRRSPGSDHGRHRGKRGCRGESIRPSPGREGERRGGARRGRGGAGEDHHPCRRRRAGGAIRFCASATS